MKCFEKLLQVLSLPAAYRVFRRLAGGEDAWTVYLNEYVRPGPGEKVLDIGCGPADVLDYLPEVDYTGLDYSPRYIDSAKKRFGSRGRFWCNEVAIAPLEREEGTFDLVLATGVVHHLDDNQAARLFELARLALKPKGRLITFDGCYVSNQSKLVRWILSKDRGKFVRRVADYERLASSSFPKVECHLRNDLLRIPYTHLIMRCTTN